MKEQTMFAAEYPRLAASCPVSKPSPTSPHLPYGNPACVLSLSAAWTHTTKTHPGVNLDHDGNYCLCVQPVGGYCPLREESSSRFCLLTLEKTARGGRQGREERNREKEVAHWVSALQIFLSAFSRSFSQFAGERQKALRGGELWKESFYWWWTRISFFLTNL